MDVPPADNSIKPGDASTARPLAAGVSLEEAKRDYRWLRRFLIASLIIGCANCFALNLVDPDLWGHVRYGQDLLADGELPRTATHTFTAEGYRWINHENIAEIVFTLGFDWLGVQGVLWAKCLLGMGILGLMYFASRRFGVRPLTLWAFLLVIALCLNGFFPIRPQLLSFGCCALLLFVLDRAFALWTPGRKPSGDWQPSQPAEQRRLSIQWTWLATLPLLMLLWTNSHGGFVAGAAILTAYLGGRGLELLIAQRLKAVPALIGLTVVLGVTLAATLMNPYGIELHRWIAESLGSPRPEITEWGPPTMDDRVFWPLVGLILINLASWCGTKERRDYTQAAILALVAWQAVTHLRHVAFFALLSGFWTPRHLQSWLQSLRTQAAEGLPVVQLGKPMKYTAALLLAGSTIVSSGALGYRLQHLDVPRSRYPVDALEFMSERGLHGRLVVSFNWAQYALAALAPDTTVSFDGRFRTCYPQEVVDQNFDFLVGHHSGHRYRSPKSGPIDNQAVLEAGNPDLVLLDRRYKGAVSVMEGVSGDDGKWSLLYQDAVAQVWGRKTVFDQPDSPRYLATDDRLISNWYSRTSRPWPAFPTTRGSSNNSVSDEVAEARTNRDTISSNPAADG